MRWKPEFDLCLTFLFVLQKIILKLDETAKY